MDDNASADQIRMRANCCGDTSRLTMLAQDDALLHVATAVQKCATKSGGNTKSIYSGDFMSLTIPSLTMLSCAWATATVDKFSHIHSDLTRIAE